MELTFFRSAKTPKVKRKLWTLLFLPSINIFKYSTLPGLHHARTLCLVNSTTCRSILRAPDFLNYTQRQHCIHANQKPRWELTCNSMEKFIHFLRLHYAVEHAGSESNEDDVQISIKSWTHVDA
jgi:hypothetical protein